MVESFAHLVRPFGHPARNLLQAGRTRCLGVVENDLGLAVVADFFARMLEQGVIRFGLQSPWWTIGSKRLE